MAHHVQRYAFQTWKLLSSVWTAKDFARDASILAKLGRRESRDVDWRVFPAGELGLALQKGEVDAVADSEPIGTLLLADGKVRNVADQATDAPYKNGYCCAVVVNGKFLANNPAPAETIMTALFKVRDRVLVWQKGVIKW